MALPFVTINLSYLSFFEFTQTLKRSRFLMFMFLQDSNWPVYIEALSFLMKFESKLLEPYIKKYLEQAYRDDDMWINEIKKLASKMKINL